MLDELYSEEIWKPIKGHENFYEVSDLGRVRTLRSRRCILRPQISEDGYCRVYLFAIAYFVHRLVLEAFIGLPPNVDSECDHLDKNRSNNKLANLEWVSPKINVYRSWAGARTRILTKPHKEETWDARVKLTDEQVLIIYNSPLKQMVLAEQFCVSRSLICSIKSGLRRSYLTQAAV